ncbi:MAG: hypothetical protein KF851_07425 [Pirellulaceae bacterium]|nr:hypothetical protein [Pirellulaceae bacterium]
MSSSNDPRLRAFGRQAAAIVVASGGLNAQSQARLRSLAVHLRMSEEEFSLALSELKVDAETPVQLNRYEQHYVRFLNRSMGALPSKILPLPLENRALKLAETKYQISLPRARQLLENVCEQFQVKRVSLTDAEALIEQSVEDEIAEALSISKLQRQNFYQLGETWGVPVDRVDEFIAQTLDANARLERSERRRRLGFRLVVVSFCLLLTATAYGVWRFVQPRNPPPVVRENTLPIDSEVLSTSWLPAEVSNPNSSVEPGIRQLIPLFRNLETADATQPHSQRYREIIAKLFSLSAQNVPEAVRLTAVVAAADPNFDTNFLNRDWVAEFVLGDSEESRVSSLRRRAVGWQILAAWSELSTTHPPEPLVEVVQKELGISLANIPIEDRGNAIRQRLLQTEWEKLLSLPVRDPEQALILCTILLNLSGFDCHTPQLLEYGNRVATSSLFSRLALTSQSGIETEIPLLIQSANDYFVEAWLEIAERQESSAFRQEVWRAVALRDGVSLDAINPQARPPLFLKKKLDLRKTRLAAIVAANEQAEFAEKQLIRQAIGWRLPEMEYAAVAAWATVTMQVANESLLAATALEHRLPNQSRLENFRRESLDVFPRMPLPRLPVVESTSPSGVEDSRATLSLLSRLADTDVVNEPLRISALRQLSQRSLAKDSPSRRQVLVLAQYYLRQLGLAERIAAEQAVQSFAKWPIFLITLADEIDSGQLSVDEAKSLVQLVTGTDFQFGNQDNWRIEFKHQILAKARANLEASVGEEVSIEKHQWQAIQRLTSLSYQLRCELLAGIIPEGRDQTTIIQSTARQIAGNVKLVPINLALEMDAFEQTDLSRVVSSQREFLQAWIQRSAAANPETALSHMEELETAISIERPAAASFLTLEFLFLKWVSQDRQATYERLMKTGGW